ncbi:hypothetical protein MPTK2_8g15560 [Marchantia polymorpha subsp. ruderalis]
MEVAGLSIVSDAAELATRGMESADVEPELPFAVQDLIRRLEGKVEVWLPELSGPEFRDFFPACASPSTIVGWQGQVRLRVLEAIGSCDTFTLLDIQVIFGGDISRLTASEWEVLLRGFRCSTVLRVIRVEDLTWNSDAEMESLCFQLGRILNTSSVIDLTIVNCSLSARCFLNLASGLRENCQSKLKSLDLHNAWEDSSAVKHVADMINSATRLRKLSLGSCSNGIDDMDEAALGILSQALLHSSSLKEIKLVDVKWGASLLLKALAGDDGNRSIERLLLENMDRLGDCIRELLISNRSLKEVRLNSLRMLPEEWHQLGEAIRDHARAANIIIEFYLDENVEDNWKSIEALACAASSDVKDPTVDLVLTTPSDHEVMLSLNLLGRVLRGEIRSLKSFSLSARHPRTSGSNQDTLKSILPMNGKTGEASVLKSLTLRDSARNLFKGIWKQLFWYLRENTSLTYLDLNHFTLDEEAFRDLMGLLQVNLTLQEIDVSYTSWAKDGKAAQIQEALKQNQKRAVYMSVFRETRLAFGDAKAGRLFLCGSPRAGKTHLRQTLMRIIQGKSWLGNKWCALRRTKGIEVEFLQNNDKMQISIWDLAGQWIFRTLQNVLFPQTNNFCVFIFVYSPFGKPESCFRDELEDWLSFITSSTKCTGHNLPQVLVVISHKDKVISNSLNWAHSIVDELTKRFANFVDLLPIEDCCFVDTRKRKQVIPLKNHIFQSLEKLLSEKSPRVPKLCSQLTSLFATTTKENRSCPLWSSEKFRDFCTPILTQAIPPSSVHSVDHSRIKMSLVSYLNDIGSIVCIPNLDYIIVDPNWLTNTLLGELVALGQHFQAQEFETSYELSPDASKDGFVSKSVFAGLIEKFLGKQPCFENVDREVLENILINLDLCFKLEDTSQYFIPSFIPEHASDEEKNDQEGAHAKSMNWANMSKTSQFVGIRIQCQDERTMSLTAAFFPRFQMFMRRKLISEMDVSKENVTCSRHYLQLFLDGHQIYVEHVQSEKSHKYVDVLMLCSSQKSREAAIKYVMKHIVQELISFCASPKGCPGVALVLGVMQTRCVEMLIPSYLRRAILIEKLKSDFIRSINDKLEEIPLDSLHLVEKEELFLYEQCWPPIEGHTERISERARDLLWDSDVEAIVNDIRQKRIQQLESLQEGLISLNNDLAQCYPEAEDIVSNSNIAQMKDWKPRTSRCLSRATSSVESPSTRLVLLKIDLLGQKVDGLDERLRSVQNILQRLDMKMGQILSLQQELQSTLSDFMSRVDMIVEYSQELQVARTPKRPYVTDDVGIFYRMSALLHVGKTVRLHLMCESMIGFHSVNDQEGLKIRLDRENSLWIRKTVEISYKVMHYAVKAGLDVTFGLGQAIPDWEDLKSNIVQLYGISDDDRRAILAGGESKELQEAWLRIQQTLAPQLQNRYSEIFKLYQVKYLSLEKGGHAWVCVQCMNRGLRCGILTC